MMETSIGRAAIAKARGSASPGERVRLAHEARALVAGIDSPAADRIRSDAGALVGAFLAGVPGGPAGRALREWATVAAAAEARADADRIRRWIDARRAARPQPSPAAMIRAAADRVIRLATRY